MNVDFKGFAENVATFEATSAVKTGDLVKMSANFKVAPCAANDDFIGICVGVRDGYAAVQLSGYAEIPCTDTVTVGMALLVAGSASTAAAAETGRERLVVYAASTYIGVIL